VEPSYPSILVRQLVRDCSRQFFAIARSNEMNSSCCCSRRCFQASNITFEQTAGSHALAAAAQRERSTAMTRQAPKTTCGACRSLGMNPMSVGGSALKAAVGLLEGRSGED
jgi:hypothetical protein